MSKEKKTTARKAPKKVAKAVVNLLPLKLDLGCGTRPQEGFIGVDALDLEGVGQVVDLRGPWPWADNSVDEIYSSHFLEHLTRLERVHFWNETYRVLKDKATARVVVPCWSHECAYGDPTHQWPPVSGWAIFYTNKAWRMANAPHTDAEYNEGMFTCDFDYAIGGSWDDSIALKNDEARMFAMQKYTNSYRDIIFTVQKTIRE